MNEDMRHIRLGDLLIKAGTITQDRLKDALEEQKKSHMRLGEVFLKNGWVSERQLADALSRQLQMPLVSLAKYKPTKEAIKIIPEAVAQRLEVVPLAILESGRIAIAMADPLNFIAVDELRMMTNADFEVNVATVSDVRRALMSFYRVQGSVDEAIVELDSGGFGNIVSSSQSQDINTLSADDAPIVRLVSNILEEAVERGASDVHIEAYEKVSKVRFRVDGSLFEYTEFPSALHAAVMSRVKIIGGMDIAERRKPQDGRILITINDKRIDLRVSSLPAVYGEKVVMRLLTKDSSTIGLSNLGFFEDDIDILARMARAPYGIILVTGPTGSGKSTTLYSMLDVLNEPATNIITVEDPVEYTMDGITQVQVNEKAGLTFTEALRSILRQDPDKIMVGEIRDFPTAELAIRAALTGHLVLSTLHTNDAPSSVVRLLDMGIAPYMISSSLVAVVAQRLLRKLCPSCRKQYEINEAMGKAIGVPAGATVAAPVGCDYCRGIGYKGRIAVSEIMQVDEDVQTIINKGGSVTEIRDFCVSEKNMRLLADSARRNVLAGVTSVDEMLALSVHHD